MFRKSCRRLGHQLIKEPLPNSEHNTSARGASTFGVIMKDIQVRAGVTAVGVAGAGFVLWSHGSSKVLTVSPTGAMEYK